MWNLFVTECLKYRNVSLLCALAHTLALLTLLSLGTNMRVFTMSALMLVWFIAATLTSFKPDLSRPPETPLRLLITELPIHFGLFMLVSVVLVQGSQAVWTLSGTDPWINPAPGTALDVRRQGSSQQFQTALEGSTHPDSQLLRRQIEIGEVIDLPIPSFYSYPVRHQRPSVDNQLVLQDSESGIFWLFSHSAMLFEGIHRDSRERVGWLGPNGFHEADVRPVERFPSVPWTTADEFVLTDRSLYQVNWENRSIAKRFSLDDFDSSTSEQLSDSLAIARNVTTLQSNHHLYIFRSKGERHSADLDHS